MTGEFFLAIAAGSSAIPVGMAVLRELTSSSSEAERFERGVGLPTREKFYTGSVSCEEGGLEGLDFRELLNNSHTKGYRRSSISRYARLAPILSGQLLQLARTGESRKPLRADDLKKWQDNLLRAIIVR